MDSLLGYVFSMILSMIAAGGFWQFAVRGVNQVQDAALAQQATTINTAATLYVQDNAATLLTTAGPTTPVNINIPTLACAGYLPVAYAAGSGCPAASTATGIKNVLGQTWLIQVTQPVSGKLQAIVLSQNGLAQSDTKRLVTEAAQIPQGGFVPYNKQGGDVSMNNANAQGAFGAWNITSLASNGYINPGSGHFVSLLSFKNGNSSNTYLYRNQVAGQPQLNTMNTPVIMNAPQTLGGACTQPGAIANDANGGFLMCHSTPSQGTIWAQFLADPVASYSALPTCNSASLNQVAAVQNPNSSAPTGTGPSFYECNGTLWNPIGVDANGNLLVPNTATVQQLVITGSVQYGGSCTTQGAVSIDTNGLLVSCQNGSWAQTGTNATSSGNTCTTPGLVARDANNNLFICN